MSDPTGDGPAQRMRLTYRKRGALQYVAHLDTMRVWERAFRRARLPLAYSQGFSPHPRLALGAPLPVGAAGERELLDVWFDRPLGGEEVLQRLAPTLPEGLEAVAAEEVDLRAPALQASLDSAGYRAVFAPGAVDAATVADAVRALLALDSLPWEEERGGKLRRSDLRATVRELSVAAEPGGEVVVEMVLGLTEQATGRADSVLRALGVTAEPQAIVRSGVRLRATAAGLPDAATAAVSPDAATAAVSPDAATAAGPPDAASADGTPGASDGGGGGLVGDG